MSIKIGHSSTNEHGKISGGKSGDQTKKEVCIASWWAMGWTVVLRPKSPELAERSAKFVEDVCANDMIGYEQVGTGSTEGRNSLYQQVKIVGFDATKIKTPCECDCSSLQHVAAIAGGANLSYGSNGHTTRTMKSAFANSGDYEVLTDKKYLTSDKYLKRGDVLVKEGSHTVMALENGGKVKTEKPMPAPYIAITTSDLNLRKSTNSLTKSNIIKVIPKGSYVCVFEETGTKWVKVNVIVDGKYFNGYVSSKYLKEVDISKNEKREITCNGLNIRTGAGTAFDKIHVMVKGDKFIVISKDNVWGMILHDDILGYANITNAYSKKVQ